MKKTVTVVTGARLHFGPLAASGSRGGRFGGVGMMVDSPGWTIIATNSLDESPLCQAKTSLTPVKSGLTGIVDCDDRGQNRIVQSSAEDRLKEFVERIRIGANLGHRVENDRWNVVSSIPSHSGLGSGTQLGLAVARAFSVLTGESHVSDETLALRSGRGIRSAIGLHGFSQGGFLIDGGRAEAGESLGTLVSRIEVPDDWRILLACPFNAAGLSGAEERHAFSSRPGMSLSLTNELCRIVLMDLLPALIRSDFDRTSTSLYEYGKAVGQFFEQVQGGIFSHSRMAMLAEWLIRNGIQGVAQSSWGPTIAAFCSRQQMAEQIQQDLKQSGDWTDIRFQIVRPLNKGAAVELYCERK